ncbi:prohibitin family protein [Lysinibacillus xylanilyticus]|uniref:prohibitin family protein n=1 Tax=Lysinibacillus xylanilyticus TaxID=582475 RepID=UPI00382FBD96
MGLKLKIGGAITGLALVGGLLITPMFVEKVPVGNVGVVYNIDGVEEKPLNQGWHLVAPFDKVIDYPVKTQTVNYNSVAVATSDGKNIDLDIAFNFNVDATKAVGLYNKFGAVTVDNIADGFLRTRLRDSARQVVSKYSVIDIYGEKSSDAQAKIQESFAKDVEKLGFMVEGLTLGVPKADQATQDAIDARVKASQELEKKNTEIETARKEAERLRVQAEGEAKANRIISESLTSQLIEKQTIEKWNGVTPTVTGTGGTMVQIPTK